MIRTQRLAAETLAAGGTRRAALAVYAKGAPDPPSVSGLDAWGAAEYDWAEAVRAAFAVKSPPPWLSWWAQADRS